MFGFSSGDILVCQRDYAIGDIEPSTLIVTENKVITVAGAVADTSEILGVVRFLQRDVNIKY
jgi:hypothetical protein